MTLAELNTLQVATLAETLTSCCGSHRWVEKMTGIFPVASEEVLLREATSSWYNCTEEDWLEAFSHHPKIGDLQSLQQKFGKTSTWAAGEQAAVKESPTAILEALADGNKSYEARFGYIFIVCAAGKSAAEMLALLQARLHNEPSQEINVAMEEQNKITGLRLRKLLS
jgi:2-oxo-4-hydroxy-4-carboxy-5-ureidoimidazoline decarboxylase